MSKFIEIITTCPDRQTAEAIGEALVEKRLAACAQISAPIYSIYHWDGKIERATEYYCVLKARKESFLRVSEIISSLHPYKVPEIIARPIDQISESYKIWLEEFTQPKLLP